MILLRNIQRDGVPVNLFIQGERIHRILPFPEEGGLVADEVVDCTGKAVIPGFVNMHTHAAMVLLRGPAARRSAAPSIPKSLTAC